MRRLAQRLDVTSTALYWHVCTKEDLLDLALDHAIGEVPIPGPGLDPRPALRALLFGWRAAMLAHPWSPSLLGRPLLGPNVLARTEFLHATLAGAGLSGIDLAAGARLLADFVIGAAMSAATWLRLDDPAVLDKVRAHITGRGELYPTLNVSGFVDREWSDDDLFRLGLDRILDTLMSLRKEQP
jgi:AcrR family transcriptional regulator